MMSPIDKVIAEAWSKVVLSKRGDEKVPPQDSNFGLTRDDFDIAVRDVLERLAAQSAQATVDTIEGVLIPKFRVGEHVVLSSNEDCYAGEAGTVVGALIAYRVQLDGTEEELEDKDGGVMIRTEHELERE